MTQRNMNKIIMIGALYITGNSNKTIYDLTTKPIYMYIYIYIYRD